MKKATLLTLLLGLCLVFSFAVSEKALNTTAGKPTLVPNEIIVKFAKSADFTTIKGKYGLVKKADSYKKGEFVVFKHSNPQAILKQLKNEPGIIYAEQNGYAYACMIPNDPYYSPYQWHMTRIGMEAAWDINAGSGAIVAVVDTGVKQTLADLAGTSFMAGWDFVNNDNNPLDDEGHGSHVCGTIAQSTNNSVGVTGIAYNATIMPVKVLDATGSGTYDWIANGIIYATDHGADVINMSLGGSSSTTALQDAVNYAWNNGVVVVCAAGNNGVSTPFYPAAYTNSISVSAINSADAKASYSNYGSTIDICGPGGDDVDRNGDGYMDGVLQNTFGTTGDGYYFYTGTSMACPHVAGVAALLKSQDGTRTNTTIRSILQNSAEDLGTAGWDQYFGYGLVDAYGALTYSPQPTVDMYVSNIAMTIAKILSKYQATAVITIKDTNNALVSGATVYVTWSGRVTGSTSGVTGTNGTVTFLSAKTKYTGPYTITVTNVTHPSKTYNAALNVETSDSITY